MTGCTNVKQVRQEPSAAVACMHTIIVRNTRAESEKYAGKVLVSGGGGHRSHENVKNYSWQQHNKFIR